MILARPWLPNAARLPIMQFLATINPVEASYLDNPSYTGLTFEDWFTLEWVDIQGATIECRACGAANTWDKSDTYLEADGGGG